MSTDKPATLRDAALHFHEFPRPGKLEIVATKPLANARDLSLAYSPGVAIPCEEIAADPEAVYKYTSKGNLVAVISNGTAVLGLGNIGPLASKPVMEGKAVLFKKFAGIDVFDIEVDAEDPDRFIEVVAALEPTFGGINLEDIKAPECFEVEEALIDALPIPVFHDDQHGTAIVVGAALLNGLEIQGKAIGNVRVVIAGAGAAGIAWAAMLSALGIAKEHIVLVDSRAVVYSERTDLNRYKRRFATQSGVRTLADALRAADVFIGVSGPGTVTAEMVCSMTERPLIFALANPDPEVSYNVVERARPDAIFASGRSDYPNQSTTCSRSRPSFVGRSTCGRRGSMKR